VEGEVMIKRYLSTEIALNHNKYVLHPMKAVVTEEANGMFELEIELPKGTLINKMDIITAPTPRGVQPFRVYRITKTLQGIKAYARHIFYDLANAFLIDTRPTNANVNSALQSIFTEIGWSGWSYLSDITEQKTAYYIRKNPVEAIIGAENSILNVWGGNLVRDNKEVRIYADGLDRGYEIRLGKNLIGIEDDSDDSNVVTRLYPTYEKDQVIYGIPEQYVDSPLIGNYPTPITKEIRVALTDDQKGYTDEQIYQVLRDYCNNLYTVDNVDKPVVNYKVDFVELSKIARLEQEVSYNYAGLEQLTYETIETLTYDQLESVTTVQQFIDLLEQIDLYDKVKIRVKELDIDLQARVIKYQYDALAERYIKIELGGFKNSNQYQINNIVQQMKNDREKASTEYRELYDLAINQVTGNKGGYQITRLNANNEPYETLWMDTPDIETAVNVLRINQSGIAGSANGFNGPYNVAITTDGWVVAERILANQLSAISANLGEVTTGVLRSTDNTLRIDLGNKTFSIGSGTDSVHTDLQYNGLQVKDGDDLIASFGESGAVIPNIASNVLNTIYRTGTYSIGNGMNYGTLSDALSKLFADNNKIHTGGDVILTLQNNLSENVLISGLMGTGRVIIDLNGYTLNGSIYADYCTLPIYIIGGTIKRLGNSHSVRTRGNFYMQINNCNIDNAGGWNAVEASHGGVIHVQNCDIVNCDTVVNANNAIKVVLSACRGNVNSYVVKITEGAQCFMSVSAPAGGSFTFNDPTTYNLIEQGTIARLDSTYLIPPVTNQQFTQVFTPTSIYTVNHDTSSVDNYYPNQAAQGRWSGMSYAKDGCFKFSADAYNFMQGVVSIDSVKMRVKRRSTSHGYSSGVTPKPYGFSGTFNAISLGQWSNWVTVPSSLFTSAGPVLKFYGPVLNTDYAIFDACEVEIKVTKAV
jgi:phage minor structural protein